MYNEKETYLTPTTEVISFAAADVIATSGETGFAGDEDLY